MEYFDFAPSLADHLRCAALVISHAGGWAGWEGQGGQAATLHALSWLAAPTAPPVPNALSVPLLTPGSGSIFEALRLRRPLVVVPNPALMDNHQAELADKVGLGGSGWGAWPGEGC